MSINVVVQEGNLTKDPDQKSGGVVKLRIAVNDRVKDKSSGEWTNRPNYFDVTAFGKCGEWAVRDFGRGSGIVVYGRLRWREWTQDNGDKRQSVEIIADRIVGTEKRTAGTEQAADAFEQAKEYVSAHQGPDEYDDDSIPF